MKKSLLLSGMLCGVLSAQSALASDPFVMDFETFIKITRAHAEQASRPQVHASSSSLPSTSSSHGVPSDMPFPFGFNMHPGMPTIGGYMAPGPFGFSGATAGTPWPQEINSMFPWLATGQAHTHWLVMDELGLDLPVSHRVGWLWAFESAPPHMVRQVFEALYPQKDGKRTSLLTLPDLPLEVSAVLRAYDDLKFDARSLMSNGAWFELIAAMSRVHTAFPELCTLDFLHHHFGDSYPLVKDPLLETALFNLFKALQEKDANLLTPGLARFLSQRLKTPDECTDFLSYINGKPWEELPVTTSSDEANKKDASKKIYLFCQRLSDVRAAYHQTLKYNLYSNMWNRSSKGDSAGFTASVLFLQEQFPRILTPSRLGRMARDLENDITPALDYLKQRLTLFTDVEVAFFIDQISLKRNPEETAKDVIFFMQNFPGMTLQNALHIHSDLNNALHFFDSAWKISSIPNIVDGYKRLSPHVMGMHSNAEIFGRLAHLMAERPAPKSTLDQPPKIERLSDTAISVLRPNEGITLEQMRDLLTLLSNSDVISVPQTVALLNAMGVVSIVASLEDFKSLASASEAVHASGVLHTLATQILPKDMTPMDKYKVLSHLKNDYDSGLSSVTPETAPRFLAHMRQIMPLYDPHTSGPFASFASLHLDRLSVDMNDIQSVLGRMFGLQIQLNSETDWHEAEKLRAKLAPLTARYEELLSVDMNDIQSVLGRMLSLQTRLNTETDWHEAENLRVKLAPLTARYEELLSQASASSLSSTTAFS